MGVGIIYHPNRECWKHPSFNSVQAELCSERSLLLEIATQYIVICICTCAHVAVIDMAT